MSTLDAVIVRNQFDGKTRMICRQCLGIIGDVAAGGLNMGTHARIVGRSSKESGGRKGGSEGT